MTHPRRSRWTGCGWSCGGRMVLDDVSLDGRPRQRHRAARAERLRQEHADARRWWACRSCAGGERRGARPSRPARRRCGAGSATSTQAPSVYADLTVRENLRYFAAVLGAPGSDVDRVVGEVGLGSHADDVVGRLSGGQEARVSLAAALLGDARAAGARRADGRAGPGAAARPRGNSSASLADQGTTLLVSSHVMDEAGALRPAAADARGSAARRRHPRRPARTAPAPATSRRPSSASSMPPTGRRPPHD